MLDCPGRTSTCIYSRPTDLSSRSIGRIGCILPKDLDAALINVHLLTKFGVAKKLCRGPRNSLHPNRPVTLPPPPEFTPFTTMAMLPERQKDPLTFKIHPLVPVSEEAIAVACTVFSEAKAFLTLFDSGSLVVYDQEEVVSLRAYGGAGNIRRTRGGT
jgi:hypothetical protein